MGLGRGKRLKSRQSSGYVAWRASGRHQRMQSEKRAKECVSEDFSRTRQNKSALSEGRTKRRVWADLQVQRTHRRVCVVTEIELHSYYEKRESFEVGELSMKWRVNDANTGVWKLQSGGTFAAHLGYY